MEPGPCLRVTHASLGRRIPHRQPLRRQPNGLWVRFSHSGVVVRREDSGTRRLLPRQQDSGLRRIGWRLGVGCRIEDSSLRHISAHARSEPRPLGPHASCLRRADSGSRPRSPDPWRRAQRADPWSVQCAHAGCPQRPYTRWMAGRLGGRQRANTCSGCTDARREWWWVLQCAYARSLCRDAGGEWTAVHG